MRQQYFHNTNYNHTTINNSSQKIHHYSYDTRNCIGQGFSSYVYRGVNDITNQNVAIKVINMSKITDSIHKQLLDNEILALKTFDSPHIIKMHDIFQNCNATYIITEYCDQGNLEQMIKKQFKIPEFQALKFLSHILIGYKELANHAFIHRDIKPANIFINQGNAKIGDFGFAKPINQTFVGPPYNVGTPFYMPPEALKRNLYSEKSDVFAIGVLLYEMVYGRLPWNASNEKELVNKICNQSIYFPADKIVSENCKDLIKRCLTLDEQKRITFLDILSHQLMARFINFQDKPENQPKIQTLSTIQDKENTKKEELNTNHMYFNIQKFKSQNLIKKPLFQEQDLNKENQLVRDKLLTEKINQNQVENKALKSLNQILQEQQKNNQQLTYNPNHKPSFLLQQNTELTKIMDQQDRRYTDYGGMQKISRSRSNWEINKLIRAYNR